MAKQGTLYHIGLDGKKTKRTHQCCLCNKQYTATAANKAGGECKCGGYIGLKTYGYVGRN
jgi:hypothetical protein